LKLKITVDGKVYEVEVEAAEPEPHQPIFPPTTARLPAGGPAGMQHSVPESPHSPAPGGDETKVCRSPIAGVVVRVSVQAGQAIQAHDVMLVLEAMKMETSITSPVAGKVARVKVNAGDAVQGGQVLVEFE
jgi:methylmalonyl-CoA carboxyltransferase small subunit